MHLEGILVESGFCVDACYIILKKKNIPFKYAHIPYISSSRDLGKKAFPDCQDPGEDFCALMGDDYDAENQVCISKS